MRNKLVRQAGEYLKSHQKKKHAFAALSLACIIIAATVYGALSMPAISMSKDQPKLEAERTSAVFGEAMEVRVSAEAPEGTEPYTFVLHTSGNGGGLSTEYTFDEQDNCQLEMENEESFILHRERRSNGVANYYFTLDAGQSMDFSLIFEEDSWIAPDEQVEEDETTLVSSAPLQDETNTVSSSKSEMPEEAPDPPESSGNEIEATLETSELGEQAEIVSPAEVSSSNENATPSGEPLDVEGSPNRSDISSDETSMPEKDSSEESSREEKREEVPEAPESSPEEKLPEEDELDFLAKEGEEQFLKFRCAMDTDCDKALQRAIDSDEALKLSWKESLEEITLTAITKSGVTVTMTGQEDAFPAGNPILSAEELTDSETVNELDLLDRAAQENELESLTRRLFDIKLLLDGKEVQPLGPVTITFSNLSKEAIDNARAKVYHIDEKADTATDMGAFLRNDGSVIMETNHFSIYGVLLGAADSNSITVDDLLEGFGITNQFAVFANGMKASNHMQGSIAVKNLKLDGNFVVSADPNGNIQDSAKVSLTISKQVVGDAPENSIYRFGVFAAQTGEEITAASITGTGSATVSLDPGNYQVFELDEKGHKIEQGRGNGFTVSYDSLNCSGNLSAGTGFENKANYVESFLAGNSNTMNIDGGGLLYVGNETAVNGNTITSVNGSQIKVQNVKEIRKPTNIDWGAEFHKLVSFSKELAACGSDYDPTDTTTPGVRFLNLTVPDNGDVATALEETVKNVNSTGILIGAEQYLIINLDCSAVTGDVITLPNLGVNRNNAGGWNGDNCRLIWNVVRNGSCYTGTVRMQNAAAGILLIPKGTVNLSSELNGSILANQVIKGAYEIHQCSFRPNSTIRTTVINTYHGATKGLTLKKTDPDRKVLSGAVFELYASNEEWEKMETAPLQTKTSNGNGIITFDQLSKGKYLLFESEAPNGYIKLSEPWQVEITEEGVTLNGDIPAEDGTFSIINHLGGMVTNVSVTKKWAGDGDGAGRPGSVKVWLTKNGKRVQPAVTLNSNNEWMHTWSNLPLDIDGEEIAYSVEEEGVSGYTTTISQTEGTAAASGWKKVDRFTSGRTYLLVYDYNNAALTSVGANSSNLSIANVDIKSDIQPAATAMWKANASGNGFKLTNVGTSRTLGLFKKRNFQWKISTSSNVLSQVFQYKDGRLFARYNGDSYYLYSDPDQDGEVIAYSNYAIPFSLYEWQESNASQLNFTVTNTKEAVTPNKTHLEHRKTIDALRDGQNNPDTTLDDQADDLTDLYRLYLDLKAGMIGSPADVVLVLDNSNSMQTADMDGETRAKVVVDTAEWFTKQVLNSDPHNRVSIVGYSGSWKGTAGENGLTNQNTLFSSGREDAWSTTGWSKSYDRLKTADLEPLLEDILKKNGTSSSNGSGTNIMQALRTAGTLLDGSERERPEAHRYMIFISDGYPTYYYLNPNSSGVSKFNQYQYKDWYQYSPDGTGSYNFYSPNYSTSFGESFWGRFGTGTSSSGDYAKQPTIDYAVSMRQSHHDTTVYSLGVGSASDTTSPLMADTLKKIASNGQNYFVANDKNSVENAFQIIMYGKPASNVSVTDHLSQYVEWYGEQPDVLVTMKQANGSVVPLWKGTGAAKQGIIGKALPGNIVKQADGTQISVIQSVIYTPNQTDTTTGTVRVIFNPDYELQTDCTYTLSFNVKTSQTAYREHTENLQNGEDGYVSVKGDDYTDYPGNDTSSGKSGFHSNQEAQVGYVIENVSYQEQYNHPVIQVGSCGLYIRKADISDDNKLLSGAEFDLYRAVKQDENAVEIPGVKDTYGIRVNEKPLLTGAQGEITVKNLAPGEYYLVETRAPTGYQLLKNPIHFNLMQNALDILGDGSAQSMAKALEPEEDGLPGILVMNSNGYDLPHTGGGGILLYVGSGLLLMAAAGTLLLLKRRNIKRGS